MENLNIVLGRFGRDVLVTAPDRFEGHLKLTVPEFYATADDHPFAIAQGLIWRSESANGHAEFALDAPASDIGLDFHGSLSVRGPGVAVFEAYAKNAQGADITDAHHTIHLDVSTMPRFDDPDGARTFVYTNTGWVSVADLLRDLEERPPCIWVGATYGERTVIWRTIARQSASDPMVVAMAVDKAYALASDHPDWPKGLLGGYRWGTLAMHEERVLRGRIYVCDQGLEELRAQYARDFRPS